MKHQFLLNHKKVSIAFFIILFINFCSCSVLEKRELIVGEWILEDSLAINYPEIIFNNDSTAIFTSKGDTIFRFIYKVDKSFLYLKDINGTKEKYKFISLNKDSLVFNKFRENQTKQVYKRKW